jgi:hypothetical protein
MDIANPPAVVRQAEQTEQQIVEAVKAAIEQIDDCKWTVGRLAHEWTERYANGRTDEDFAKLVGLSRANVQQRRQVFATYGDVCKTFCKLSWSHFLVVLDWNDADEWLASANDNRWSVATMKRMREIQNRADRGEDLSQPAEPVEDESEHVADVDPYKPEPSIVKPTPKVTNSEPQLVTRNTTETSATAGDTATVPKVTNSDPQLVTAPSVQHAIDNIAALVVALKPQLEADTSQTLAAQLRRWADEIDPPEEQTTATPAAAVASEWNMVPNVSRCSVVTKKRQQTVRARMQDEFWRTNWREAMQKVSRSSFCAGTNDRGWKANLDWFLRPDTVPKLMEGQFDDQGTGNAGKDVWRVPASNYVPEVEDRTQGGGTGGEAADG